MEGLFTFLALVGFLAWLFGDWLAMTAAFLADPEKRELRKLELKLEFLKWLTGQIGGTEKEVKKRGG